MFDPPTQRYPKKWKGDIYRFQADVCLSRQHDGPLHRGGKTSRSVKRSGSEYLISVPDYQAPASLAIYW